MLGMIVAQTLRRKTKMTATTRTIVRSSVRSTSVDRGADRRRAVRQDLDLDGRRDRRPDSVFSVFLIASTVVMTFAPGCLNTTRKTPRLPLLHAAWVVSYGPIVAWPMSRTRTGAPLR